VSSYPSESRTRSGYSIAIGFFAPAFIWFLHLFTASVVAEWGAFSGLNQRRFLGIPMVSWIIVLISLFAIAATIYSLRRVAQYERHIQPTLDKHIAAENSEDFLGRVAIYSGAIFLVVTCAQTIPILFFLGRD